MLGEARQSCCNGAIEEQKIHTRGDQTRWCLTCQPSSLGIQTKLELEFWSMFSLLLLLYDL